MFYRTLISLLVAAGTLTPALAQDHGHTGDDEENFRLLVEQEAEELSVKSPQDSDIINLVERIMMVRLAQTLGLSVEETQNLGTTVGQCRSRVYNLKWLRADLRQSLRESIEAGDDVAIEQKLDKLLKLEITISQLIDKMIQDSQNDLSVEQAAKFYLFIEDFEEDLSRTIDKAQQLTREKASSEHDDSAGDSTAKQPVR
jgi:hypothetical protein